MARKKTGSIRQEPETGKWTLTDISHDGPDGVVIPATFTYNGDGVNFGIPNSGTVVQTNWETPVGQPLENVEREYFPYIDVETNTRYIVSWDDDLEIIPGKVITHGLVLSAGTSMDSLGPVETEEMDVPCVTPLYIQAWYCEYEDGVLKSMENVSTEDGCRWECVPEAEGLSFVGETKEVDHFFAKVKNSDTEAEGAGKITVIYKGHSNVVELNAAKYGSEYLTFDILTNGNITWKSSGEETSLTKKIQYSINGGAWEEITSSYAGESFSINAGDKVRFKGINDCYSYEAFYNSFDGSTAEFNAHGNMMSLLYGDDFSGKMELKSGYTFYRLFYATQIKDAFGVILPAETLTSGCYCAMFSGCTSLTSAPELPATTLAEYCYDSMFLGCTSLTSAPELPAMVLTKSCYDDMFAGCTSLTEAPELSALELEINCYNNMFAGCTSLTESPKLPASALTSGCYAYMFAHCTSLTSTPELPATTLVRACYAYMFMGCTSLASAHALPARTLGSESCIGMFEDCTNLSIAPELPATTLASDCYERMFANCTGLTTAPSELPARTLANYCYNNMFRNCTSLTTAPELPAEILTDGCYKNMFYGCTNLSYIKCLATNIIADGCTNDWVSGVASAGTFVKAASMSGWPTGVDGIPSGWSVSGA